MRTIPMILPNRIRPATLPLLTTARLLMSIRRWAISSAGCAARTLRRRADRRDGRSRRGSGGSRRDHPWNFSLRRNHPRAAAVQACRKGVLQGHASTAAPGWSMCCRPSWSGGNCGSAGSARGIASDAVGLARRTMQRRTDCFSRSPGLRRERLSASHVRMEFAALAAHGKISVHRGAAQGTLRPDRRPECGAQSVRYFRSSHQHAGQPTRRIPAEDQHAQGSAESGCGSRTPGKTERPGIRRLPTALFEPCPASKTRAPIPRTRSKS